MAKKITNLVIFTTVMMLVFHFGGLIDGSTPISFLLTLALDPENIRLSSFYKELAAALTLVAGAGVVIGLFVSQKTELAVKAGIVGYLILMSWDLLILFQTLKQVNVALATLIVSPMLLIFLLSAFEWWGGND